MQAETQDVCMLRLSTGPVYSVIHRSRVGWDLHWDGGCFKPSRENQRWCVQQFWLLRIGSAVDLIILCVVGWMMGERLHDGEKGWFPSRVVEEIHSKEVRAQNLREAYRVQQAHDSGGGPQVGTKSGIRAGRRVGKNPDFSSRWSVNAGDSNEGTQWMTVTLRSTKRSIKWTHVTSLPPWHPYSLHWRVKTLILCAPSHTDLWMFVQNYLCACSLLCNPEPYRHGGLCCWNTWQLWRTVRPQIHPHPVAHHKRTHNTHKLMHNANKLMHNVQRDTNWGTSLTNWCIMFTELHSTQRSSCLTAALWKLKKSLCNEGQN